MSKALLGVSHLQLLDVWDELMRCLYGDNNYGSTVAEIYLFRVMSRDPFLELNRESQHAFEAFAEGCQRLYDICKLFEERHGVKLALFEGPHIVDGHHLGYDQPLPLEELTSGGNADPWRHRVHIGILDEQESQDERSLQGVEEA